MQCHGYHPGDLLITFPACKDPGSCNPAFITAAQPFNESIYSQETLNVPFLRVFGPERLMLDTYLRN